MDKPIRPHGDELREASEARPSRDDSPRRDNDSTLPTEPAPGVRHEPEPDAENLIPVKDEPGTL
jgi:hypothetical protein